MTKHIHLSWISGYWRHLALAGMITALVACGDHSDGHGHAHDGDAAHSHADGDHHSHDNAPQTEAFYSDDASDEAISDSSEAEVEDQSSGDAEQVHSHEDGHAHSH